MFHSIRTNAGEEFKLRLFLKHKESLVLKKNAFYSLLLLSPGLCKIWKASKSTMESPEICTKSYQS